MAEGVGFEPTELSLYGFQDRRLRPLGHPSLTSEILGDLLKKNNLTQCRTDGALMGGGDICCEAPGVAVDVAGPGVG